MNKVYTIDNCPYCERAKVILQRVNYQYEEIHIDKTSPKSISVMHEAVGSQYKTFPQIIVNDEHIGGYDSLLKMYKGGQL